MYEIIQKAHSGVAYSVLLVLLVAVINAFVGFISKKQFLPKDRRMALFAMILCHLQLLLGLVLYFLSPLGLSAFGEMSNAELRLTSLEHPLVNILAIVFITIGWSKHKKENTDTGKFKKIAFLYLVGLLFILSRIPWTNWFN